MVYNMVALYGEIYIYIYIYTVATYVCMFFRLDIAINLLNFTHVLLLHSLHLAALTGGN